jgi:predicted acetyltransferase
MKSNAENLSLVKVDDHNKIILDNLAQGYEAEFSTLTQKMPDEWGRYVLDTEIDEVYSGYLFYKNEQVVGFTIIDIVSDIYDVGEFYIIPAVRGGGVGRQFAKEIFNSHPGHWQLRQLYHADASYKFWLSVIASCCVTSFKDEIVEEPYWGKIHRQLFKI